MLLVDGLTHTVDEGRSPDLTQTLSLWFFPEVLRVGSRGLDGSAALQTFSYWLCFSLSVSQDRKRRGKQ